LLMFLNEVALALYFRKSLAVCNSTFANNVYIKFYEARVPIFNDPTRPPADRWGNDVTYRCDVKKGKVGSNVFSPALMATDFNYIADVKRTIYKSLMNLKPWVNMNITNRLDAMGIHNHTRYIGVHIRHGDKAVEMSSGLIATEDYARTIQRELNATGITMIYIASDDPHAAALLTGMLDSNVKILQQFTNSSKVRSYGDEVAVLDFLTDVEALRRASVFIGTQSSNTGRMIYYGRSYFDKSVSLDGGWHKCPKKTSDAKCPNAKF